MQIKATTLVLALATAACSSGSTDKPVETQHQGSAQGFKAPPKEAGSKDLYAPITEPGKPLMLGAGVDLNNHAGIINKCVEGKVETVKQQEGYLSLDADYTRSDIESYLGADTSGSVSFLLWSASARAHFARKSREQSFGLNYIVFAFNKDHSKVFIPTGRSAEWKTASQDEWMESCGDGYVAAQDYGSMLLVKFSVTLDRKTSSNNWGGSAGGGFMSFAKLRASIEGNSSSKRDRGTLSVSALQIGGKPSELGKILQTNADSGLVENFALCNVEDVPKCLEGLRSIEHYIAQDFPKQIEDDKKGGSSLLTTYPFRYPKTMGVNFNPGLDHFVLDARKTLNRLYEEEMLDITTLKANARKEDSESQATIEQAQANIAAIRETAQLCYKTSTYNECVAQASDLEAACAETTVPEDFLDDTAREGGSGSDE
jgi:hypothetical protein